MILPKFKNIRFESYKPGKSNLRKFKNVIKLSANESALGTDTKENAETEETEDSSADSSEE